MRITLNFSPAASARDRHALKWAIPVAIVGLTALIVLCRSSYREHRQYQDIQAQLQAAQARTAELHGREEAIRRKLEDPANRDLFKRARFVNELITRRRLSLSDMSSRIVNLLPEDAHLTELALASPKKPGEGYTVRMGITARNEDSVQTFMNHLEDAPDFKDPSISNQGFQEEISQPDHINIVCTAQYLPEVNVNVEKPSAEKSTPDNKSNR